MPSASPTNLDEAIDWLRKSFDPVAASGLDVAYQLELSGPGGGEFFVRVSQGRPEIGPGQADSPDVRFRLAAADYFGILAGRENADLLYMGGRLEIEGDLSLAMKLRSLFRAPA